MVLRVTQQRVEVLGTNDSDLRATQHYAEVLGSGTSDLRVTSHYIEILSIPTDLIVPPALEPGDIPNGEDLVKIDSEADILHTVRNFRRSTEVEVDPEVEFTYGKRNARFETDVKINSAIVITFVRRNMRIANEVPINQSFAYLNIGTAVNCYYAPMIGASTDPNNPEPPSPTVPTLGNDTLTLFYPYDTPSLTLTLRNPQFGDTNTLQFNRINRQTRLGTILVFADPNWPKQQTLSVEITALTEDQVQSFFDFCSLTLGKEIGLTDYEARTWKGIILSPEPDKTDQGRTCKNVLRFEFAGELQD